MPFGSFVGGVADEVEATGTDGAVRGRLLPVVGRVLAVFDESISLGDSKRLMSGPCSTTRNGESGRCSILRRGFLPAVTDDVEVVAVLPEVTVAAVELAVAGSQPEAEQSQT